MIGALVRLLFLDLLGNLLVALANLVRLPRLRRRPRWVELVVREPLPARPPHGRRRLRRAAPSLAALGELVDELAADRRLTGVVVRLEEVPGGWARLQTLRGLLARLRGAGKRVVAHLSAPGLREYYVACAADSILCDESGPLQLTGLAVETTFWTGLLDRLGVEAEAESRGAYKSFAEAFTRRDLSPASREALEAVLDRVHGELRDAIAAARGLDAAGAAERMAGGPYLPADAEALGLVDGVRYVDEIAAWLGDGVRAPAPVRAWRRARLRPLRWHPLRPRRAIRVIALHGAIMSGEGAGLRRRVLGARAAQRALSGARRDRATAAVVLHVDSRGGSAQASDLIWREVALCGREKPVVAYFDDVAASGGYYLACAARRIVAQPLTLTGSIGVVGGKLNVAGLYQRLGITTTVLARGEAATMRHLSRGLSEEERRRLQAEIDGLYQQFVRRVAEGRGLAAEAAEAAAQGRVWTGADALEQGLVDELGDVDAAIAAARALVRGRPGERFEVRDQRIEPRRRGLLGLLLGGERAEPARATGLLGSLPELCELVALAEAGPLLAPSYLMGWPAR